MSEDKLSPEGNKPFAARKNGAKSKDAKRKGSSGKKDQQAGRPQKGQGSKKENGSSNGSAPRRTERVKHVHIDRERPHLSSYGNDGERSSKNKKRAEQRARAAARRAREGKETLKIIPLGGLDAIGKNMTVFECGDDIILDDAGVMFPDDDHPGVDLILPDYTYLLESAHKLRGIVVTHGHEDHTGTLPYLLKDLDIQVPIYATKLTLGLIEGKLKEHKIKNAKLCEIKPGQVVKLGCLEFEAFAVNHSIPGALGLFFRTPGGNVLHTGDFKLDQTPIDGVHTDFNALARFGEEGVDLMMSDSTNATRKSFTPSEAEVGKALRPIISQAKGRVIIASFASHIHRLQQICDAAVDNGRKVAVTGRSMVQNTDIARRLGYLHISDENLIDSYDLKDLPNDRYVLMCTGSQGEPLSALARIANGNHRTISIEEGDTVIISATPVPGNEKAVTRVVNQLAKIGADVYDKSRALVHVSGHASSEELKLVLSIVQPDAFMPVHGEPTHLRAHAKLAEEVGVDPDNIFIIENGDSLELSSKGVRRGPSVPSGIVLVDGLSVGDTSEEVLSERVSLGSQGVAAIALVTNKQGTKLLDDVALTMAGIPGGDDEHLVKLAANAVGKAVSRSLEKGEDLSGIRKSARSALLSILWERTNQRPLVIVNVLNA